MQAGILNNPRPSSGYNAVLGNIPASGPPSAGALASMTPSVSNNVKEPMVNAIASYPILVQPYSNHMERYLHPGDLLFVYVGAASATSGTMRRGKPVIVANLPILNHILAGNLQDSQGRPQYDNPWEWKWIGVMRNDMQLSGGAPGVNHRYTVHRRLINVDVRGATRMFNYWSDAKIGEQVGLRVVQCRRKKPMRAANDVPMNAAQHFRDNTANNDFETYWQILPAQLDDVRSVSDNENLMSIYENPKDIADDDYNAYIDIGYCFQHLGRAETVNDRAAVIAASNFQDDRFRLPVIPMFIRT